jgi:T-complex protein 1 subunit theta
MVINHLEKLFVTNDAATILRELEVQHPAAKMLVLASQQQEQECGDGTNFVLIFAGALLENAEQLIRMVHHYYSPEVCKPRAWGNMLFTF